MITVWLRTPLNEVQLAWLNRRCRVRLHNRPAKFDYRLKQRLQLFLPSFEVLQWISRLPFVHLNRVDLALDWIFDGEAERDEAYELVTRYHVKKYHRDQGIRFVKGGTRYTGPPTAPNNFVMYGDKPCRTTGELYSCTSNGGYGGTRTWSAWALLTSPIY
jgi:hypothetical protein